MSDPLGKMTLVKDTITTYKVELRSDRHNKTTITVFNNFFINAAVRVSEQICNSCLLEGRDSGNILFVSFSILPDTITGKIQKRLLAKDEIQRMPVYTLQAFKTEITRRLRKALEVNIYGKASSYQRFDEIAKSIDYKVIVNESGNYYLYENFTLTEFYRIAKTDQIYYPIDNDNITINPIARIFSLSEFRQIFKNGVSHVDDGFLAEHEKTKVDRPRLSGRIFRDNSSDLFGGSTNTYRFWSPAPFSLNLGGYGYISGITVFDFNSSIGIVGGGYNFYFQGERGHNPDQYLLNQDNKQYFKAFMVNNVPLEKFEKDFAVFK